MKTQALAFVAVALSVGCTRGTPVEEISVSPTADRGDIPDYVPDGADWTSWRGPNGNGVSVSATAPTSWSESENVIWSAAVPGRGHSSPVVCGNQVFLATALDQEQRQLIVAFDRNSGEEQWEAVIHEGGFPRKSQMHAKGSHANGTVVCDDQFLFTAFLNKDSIVASAVDFEGNLKWQTTLGSFNSIFGYAPSPLVYKSLVIFAADNEGGGYLAAVNRRTGKLVWRKARSRPSSYSSPVVATVAGQDQLLISGGDKVCSYDPNNGELIWSCRGASDATCGTIVWNGTTVFASGGHPGKETLAIRADGSNDVIWSHPVKHYEPSMLLVDNALYSVTDNGIAHCWDSETGKLHWRQRLGGSFSASPVFCGGEIYAANLSGTTFVFKASSDGYQQTAKNKLGEDTYASPAICNGQIFMRVGIQPPSGRQERLFCLGSK